MSAALDVVDRDGFDGLTIRAVANIVGAPPMSLYTHFANKEELLDLMYVEVSRRLYPDAGFDTWQAELTLLAKHIRAMLLAHPGWTPILSRPAPPAPIPVRERLLKLMVKGDMTSAQALHGLAAAILAAIGLALVELTFLEPDGAPSFTRRFDRTRTWLEAERAGLEPVTREAFAGVPRFDFDNNFEIAIGALIDGLG